MMFIKLRDGHSGLQCRRLLPLLSIPQAQFVSFVLIPIPRWRTLMNGTQKKCDLLNATAQGL